MANVDIKLVGREFWESDIKNSLRYACSLLSVVCSRQVKHCKYCKLITCLVNISLEFVDN